MTVATSLSRPRASTGPPRTPTLNPNLNPLWPDPNPCVRLAGGKEFVVTLTLTLTLKEFAVTLTLTLTLPLKEFVVGCYLLAREGFNHDPNGARP